MSTQPPVDRIALDAAAVVQSLSRCAAEFQAKAAAQKAVVAAATSRKLGLLAADAALMVEVYEEAAATMFSTIQGIVTGKGTVPGVAGATSAQSTSPLPLHCDAVSPKASQLYRRCCYGKLAAPDRYGAFVELVRELSAHSVPLQLPAHEALVALYAAITDKLPDLGEVDKALSKIEQDWRALDRSSTTPDPAQVRRSDWFKKMRSHIEALLVLRGRAVDGDGTSQEPYEKLVDVVLANLSSQPWPGGEVSAMVEATRRELTRLRGDVAVVVAMTRLRELNFPTPTSSSS